MSAEIANHLWQSTFVAAIIAVVARMMRHYSAEVRYCLWLTASAKFIVPFSILSALGEALPWKTSNIDTTVPFIVRQATEPFMASEILVHSLPSSGIVWASVLVSAIWSAGVLAVVALRAAQWWRIRKTVAQSTPWIVLRESRSLIPVRSTAGVLQPSVVGVWRPTVLVPIGLEQHLSHSEFRAILAHELSHVRRRDNLTAAFHMCVEALFWFHPIVWWIGHQLLSERELACDETVLAGGADPHDYAQGIVKACDRSVRTRLACAAAAGGADIHRRLEAIMAKQSRRSLTRTMKATLLAVAFCALLFVPVLAGALSPATDGSPDSESFRASLVENVRPLAVLDRTSVRNDADGSSNDSQREIRAEAGTPPRVQVTPPGTIVQHTEAHSRLQSAQRQKYVAPSYPPEAIEAQVQGIVIIEATVSASGSVVEAHVRRSIPTLDQAALDAVYQWEYIPAYVGNMPMMSTTIANVLFRLPD